MAVLRLRRSRTMLRMAVFADFDSIRKEILLLWINLISMAVVAQVGLEALDGYRAIFAARHS